MISSLHYSILKNVFLYYFFYCSELSHFLKTLRIAHVRLDDIYYMFNYKFIVFFLKIAGLLETYEVLSVNPEPGVLEMSQEVKRLYSEVVTGSQGSQSFTSQVSNLIKV